MKIVNLTQHKATEDQTKAGVIDLPSKALDRAKRLLTFSNPPTARALQSRAGLLVSQCRHTCIRGAPATHAMIGGAPYLMPYLEKACRLAGIAPVYAFSLRESVEQTMPDGSVRKVNTFKHAGFVGL